MNTTIKPCPCGGVARADSTCVTESDHNYQSCWVECTICGLTLTDERCICCHENKWFEMIYRWNSMHATWQPIETAPRDGRPFLTARFEGSEDKEFEVCRYDPYHCQTCANLANNEGSEQLFRIVDVVTIYGFTGIYFHRATHWTPIPDFQEKDK